MVLGIVLVVVLFAFGQTELGLTVGGLVASFILSRGIGKIGLGAGVVVLALSLGACESGAQVPSTCLSTAIRAAMDVIADCLPRNTDDPAAVRAALEACPVEEP
jgi:hypothetical protein